MTCAILPYRMREHGEHGVHGIHQLQDLRHSFTMQDILFVIQSALFVKQINQNTFFRHLWQCFVKMIRGQLKMGEMWSPVITMTKIGRHI